MSIAIIVTKKSAENCNLPLTMPSTAWKAVLGLLLLRLCIGWHFFSEGTKKLTFNESRNKWEYHVPTDVVFGNATGPFAKYYQELLPDFHDWQTLLAVPKQFQPPSAELIAERQSWNKTYQKRRAEAQKAEKPIPIEFPDDAPYTTWARKIIEDLRPRLKKFVDVTGISKDQAADAARLFESRHQQLADFLAEEEQAITDYQHELWRLQTMQGQGGANEIPFLQERVDAKQSETLTTGRSIVREVQGIERGLQNDLRGILTKQQLDNPKFVKQVESALVDPKQQRLETMNQVATIFLIGVGGCLLVGFLTRLASAGGIVFLVSVMLTQLPWVSGSKPDYFYYQLVEAASLVAILGYGAWRLPGIDYMLRGCCPGCCGIKNKK